MSVFGLASVESREGGLHLRGGWESESEGGGHPLNHRTDIYALWDFLSIFKILQ